MGLFDDLTPGNAGSFADLIPKPKPRGLLGFANDTVISAANQIAGGVGSIASAIVPGNRFSRFIDEDIVKAGEAKQSDIVRQSRERFQAELENADGAWDEAKAVGRYVADNPAQVLAQAAGALALVGLPMKGVGALARAAKLAPGATKGVEMATGSVLGGLMSGGDAAGTAYELVQQTPLDTLMLSPQAQELSRGGLDEKAIRDELGTRAARAAMPIPTLIGAGSGLIGAERILAGGKPLAGGALARGAQTALVEGAGEFADEAATQYFGQKGAAEYNPAIDPAKGVVGAGLLGMALGAPTGGVVGALSPGREPKPDPVAKVLDADSIDEAIKAATEATTTPAAPPPPRFTPYSEDEANAALMRMESEMAGLAMRWGNNDKFGVRDWSPLVPQPGVAADVAAAQNESAFFDEQRRIAEADRAETEREQRIAAAGAAPVIRAPRTGSTEGVTLDTAAPNAVQQFIQRQSQINTPAARAFVQEFRAGRITSDDVLALLVPDAKPEASPDARLAAAAAQAPKDTGTYLLTADGFPYGSRIGAQARANKEGGEVVRVDGGFAVKVAEPAPATPAPAAAPTAPPAVSTKFDPQGLKPGTAEYEAAFQAWTEQRTADKAAANNQRQRDENQTALEKRNAWRKRVRDWFLSASDGDTITDTGTGTTYKVVVKKRANGQTIKSLVAVDENGMPLSDGRAATGIGSVDERVDGLDDASLDQETGSTTPETAGASLAASLGMLLESGDALTSSPSRPAAPAAPPAVDQAPPPVAAPASQGFDSAAWDKAREDRIKASKATGAKHLDDIEPYVETMRGKRVRYVHDPKVTGVVRTVDNRGNVYVNWSDDYSAQKEGASPMQDGKKTVMQTSLGPRDLKDYVVDEAPAPAAPKATKAKAPKPAADPADPNAPQLLRKATNPERMSERLRGVAMRALPEQVGTENRYLFNGPAGAGFYRVPKGWKAEAPKPTAPPAPLYASRPVTNAADIMAWAASQGFKSTLPADDLHVTVAYSREPVAGDAVPGDVPTLTIRGGKRTVEPLGDEGAVVLKFTSPDMQARWKQYRDAGASWDYDSYTPHVTITYDGKGVDLAKVEPYTGPIMLGAEKQEALNVDKADDYKGNEAPAAATEASAAPAPATRKSLQESRADAALDKEVLDNGERMTRRQWVERKVAEGLTTRVTQEDRIKPMSRMQFFRANNEEQRAHERRIKEGGKKDVFWIGDYEVTKSEHDYAQRLTQQPPAVTPAPAATTPSPAPAPQAEPVATHKDPGEPAEPVTTAVVEEAIATAAENRDRPRSAIKADALRLIDEAIAKAPAKGEKKITIRVPGDGVFSIVNNVDRLKEFRRQVELSPGFKDKQPRPSIGKANESANYGPDQLAREMLEDGEPLNAIEALEAAGKTMMFGNANGDRPIPYTNGEPVEIAGIGDLFVGRGWSTKKGSTSWWSVIHKPSGFAMGSTASNKSEAIAEAKKLLAQPEKRAKMEEIVASGKSADGKPFKPQDELRAEFMAWAEKHQQATFDAADATVALAKAMREKEEALDAFYESIMGDGLKRPSRADWTPNAVEELLNAAEKQGKAEEALKFAREVVNSYNEATVEKWATAYARRTQPTDTGWQTGFQAPGGYRRIRRDVTLTDGTTYRAELDERAGAYVTGMVQKWSTNNGTPKTVQTYSNDMDARRKADGFLDGLTSAAKPAQASPVKAPAPAPDAPVSSREGQMRLANRGSRIAALKLLNEQLRKIAPSEAWADKNIEDAADLDALQDQISTALVEAQRAPVAVNPLRAELDEMSGAELRAIMDRMGLAGARMTQSERIEALLAEEEGAVRAAMTPADDAAAPQLTEEQARKQFEWRDMGQSGGTKTHRLFFYLKPEDKGTGRAMGRGYVELYDGSSGWRVDGEGESYKALADAKKAAIEAAIPVLREQGWIAPDAADPKAEEKQAKADVAPMPYVPGIPREVAQRAHAGTSHVPEVRAGQEQASFMGQLADAWDRAARAAGTDEAARARITEVFTDVAEGYRARYLRTLEARGRVMSSMIAGPARFPVERNRKRMETERKRAEEADQFLARGIKRLLRAARGPIDNSPEAELESVRLRLAEREDLQESMKAANAALRKGDDAALKELGFTAEQIADLKKPDFAGRKGFPDYRIANNNAEIRRLRERLASAEERMQDAAAGPVETERAGVKMVEDATDDRLRLIFDGKPSEEVRNDLKANGFKWSPRNEAWQRQLTDNARYAAKQVLDKHFPVNDTSAPETRAETGNVPRLAAFDRFGEGPVSLDLAKRQVDGLLGHSLNWTIEEDATLGLSTPAAYDRATGKVLVNPAFVPFMTQGQMVGVLVEEFLHGVDSLNAKRALSAGSARLAAGGDIRTEVETNRSADGVYDEFLKYPLDDQRMSLPRIQAELLARLPVLYFADPAKFRRVFPTTYEALHGVFGYEFDDVLGSDGRLRDRAWRRAGDEPNAQDGLQLRLQPLARARLAQRVDGRPADRKLGQLRAGLAQALEADPRGTLLGGGVAPSQADSPLSRGPGPRGRVSVRDARAVVDALRTAFPKAPQIRILEKVNQSPRALLEDIRAAGAELDVEAAFHKGEIYVFPGNIDSIERLRHVMTKHEIRHAGFRGLLGEGMDRTMLALYEANATVRKAADAKIAARLAGSKAEAVDEALADMSAEDIAAMTGARPLLAKLRLALRRLAGRLRAMGWTTVADAITPSGWSDADVVALVLKAESMALRGQTDGTRFSRAPADEPIAETVDEPVDETRFSRSLGDALRAGVTSAKDAALPAGYKVADFLESHGKITAWDRTVGTPYNLSKRFPDTFGRVFDGLQSFLNDITSYATKAADLAPSMLPKLESIKDIGKSPLSAEDTKAISAPIFEGTLAWVRDKTGKPVRIADAEKAAESMTVEQKAQEMLQARRIDPRVLTMWQGMEVDQYTAAINTRYNNEMLRAGVVWTDDELRSMFKLTGKRDAKGKASGQIALYDEFRKATNRSLDDLAISEMLQLGGEDTADMRDAVQAMSALDASTALRDRLYQQAAAIPDRKTVLNDAAEKIVKLGDKVADLQARGYAPLSRFGTYTLDVVNNDGERMYFGLFESQYEANRMRRKMREAFPKATITQGTTDTESFKLFRGISPETLELFGEILGLDSTGDSASDQAFQQYLKRATATRSAMKRLIHRKGTAGFSEDAGRVLAGFLTSNARRTAGNLNLKATTAAVEAIPKEQGELKGYAAELLQYTTNPVEEAAAVRGMLFFQYLGGSVASAMVNMTQPITVTMPYLSQFGGAKRAAKQVARAFKDMAAGKPFEDGLAQALKAAEASGIVQPQEIHSLMAQARGKSSLRSGDGTRVGNAAATVSNGISKGLVAWGQLFAYAEIINRRSTFIAAFRTAVERDIADPAKFAAEAVTATQFLYTKANRPRWARGAIGATIFTFKQYGISYLELLARMAKSGPEGRKAALLAIAVLFLMSGADGLPFMEDAEDVLDAFMQRIMGRNWSTKQKRNELLAEVLGKDVGAFLQNGVSGLPGVPIDVSGRMGMGNLIPGTGLLRKDSEPGRDTKELLGPIADLTERSFRAAGMALQGDVGRAALEVSPVAARNVAKGADMLETGMYRDAKGRKVIDTDTTEAIAKMAGFQPATVARVQEATATVQRAISLNKTVEAEIADQWAQGLYEKDADKVAEARERLAQWNEDNPATPIRITFQQVRRRLQTMNQDKATRMEKTAPKEIRNAVRRELAEANR